MKKGKFKKMFVFLSVLLLSSVVMAQGTFTCGSPVSDGDGNTYETVKIGSLCWMKSNMKTKTCADGSSVAKAMVYESSASPDTNYNLATFGRLYTWYSAVNVPENSAELPARVEGYVQGICPEEWHIPTVGEFNELNRNSAEDLRSTEYWLQPNSNTNATGFTALPSGLYNGAIDRFERLFGAYFFWSDSSVSSSQWALVCSIDYSCDRGGVERRSKNDGFSVRCVRGVPTLMLNANKHDIGICPGRSGQVVYTATVVNDPANAGSYTFKWKVNGVDSVTTSSSLTVNYTEGGTHTVECTAVLAGNDAMSETVATVVTVSTQPAITLENLVITTGMTATAAVANVTAGDVAEYGIFWSKTHNPSATGTKKPGTGSISSDGRFTITVPASEIGDYDTVFVQAFVKTTECEFEVVADEAFFAHNHVLSVSSVDTTVCEGGSVTVKYTATISNANASDYSISWMKNGVAIAGETGLELTIDIASGEVAGGVSISCKAVNNNTGVELVENASTTLVIVDKPVVTMASATMNSVGNIVVTGTIQAPTNDTIVEYGVKYTVNGTETTEKATAALPANGNFTLSLPTSTLGLTPCDTVGVHAYAITKRCEYEINSEVKKVAKTNDITLKLEKSVTQSSITVCQDATMPVKYTAMLTNGDADNFNFVWSVNGVDSTSQTGDTLVVNHGTVGHDTVKVVASPASSPCFSLKDSISIGITQSTQTPDLTYCLDEEYGLMTVKSLSGISRTAASKDTVAWYNADTDELLGLWLTGPDYANSIPMAVPYTFAPDKNYKIVLSVDGGCTKTIDFNVEPVRTQCTVSSILANEAGSGTAIDSVSDHEGNWYNVVQIGDQCWLKENMRATTSPTTGTYIVDHRWFDNDPATDRIYNEKYGKRAWWFMNDSATYAPRHFGLLYNWFAAVDTVADNTTSETGDDSGGGWGWQDFFFTHADQRRGICPAGWHVPSDEDWLEMESYVGVGEYSDLVKAQISRGVHSGWFASSCDWEPYTQGDDRPGSYSDPNRNSTGFSMVPVPALNTNFGERFARYLISNESGSMYKVTQYGWSASFWGSTPRLIDGAYNGESPVCRTYSYAQAYTNRSNEQENIGRSIRCVRNSLSCPTVTTQAVEDGDIDTLNGVATIRGKSVNLAAAVEDHGFVWGLSKAEMNNTVSSASDASSVADEADHVFAANIDIPQCGTVYYMAFLKTAGCNMTFGDTLSFELEVRQLPACPGTPTVTDADGNTYATIQVGDQCWMRENLKTKHYADGTPITHYSSTPGTNRPTYHYPERDTLRTEIYGLLYNWTAAMRDTSLATNANPSNVQGVCPDGWHLPSVAEFSDMLSYIQSIECYRCNGYTTYVGKALADDVALWSEMSGNCYTGNRESPNNLSGFSARPAGLVNGFDMHFGIASFMQTTTRHTNYTDSYVFSIWADNGAAGFGALPNIYSSHKSVRCVKNASTPSGSINVTTGAATEVTATSAKLNGTVANPDNVEITARGFEWKASGAADYSQVTATGDTMSHGLTSLATCTEYIYRAFVTTADGTIYGSEVTFTASSVTPVGDDGKPCSGTPTVTDHEGNVYNTVQIGNQCWMKDNLRTTTSPSTGKYLIPAADAGQTLTGKQARWYNNDSVTSAQMKYGLLYNWNAAVDTFNTAFEETSVNDNNNNNIVVTFTGHRRGICPIGWHLPSDAEWTLLNNYVGGQSGYVCGGNTTNTAKALASATRWNSSSNTCAVGSEPCLNNATGFSVVPAGFWSSTSFYLAGNDVFFWSSTQGETYDNYAFTRLVGHDYSDLYRNDNYKGNGYSVRCLRD